LEVCGARGHESKVGPIPSKERAIKINEIGTICGKDHKKNLPENASRESQVKYQDRWNVEDIIGINKIIVSNINR